MYFTINKNKYISTIYTYTPMGYYMYEYVMKFDCWTSNTLMKYTRIQYVHLDYDYGRYTGTIDTYYGE